MPTPPLAFTLTIAFLFGAIIGSFLNVVIWRLPRGYNLSHPPSHCPHCDHKIRPWENIPIVSFLMLGAKCSGCKKPISWRYPGVELLTGLVFTVLAWKFGLTLTTAAYCLFSAALIAAFFIDLELFLIPDELNNFALFTAFALAICRISEHRADALLWGWLPSAVFGAIACAGVFVLIQVLGFLMAGQEAMGGGDVLLARAIGALLPLRLALVSFLLAVAAGAVIGVGKLLFEHMRGGGPAELPAQAADDKESAGDHPPDTPGTIALEGLACMFFVDLAYNVKAFFHRLRTGEKKQALLDVEDDFVPTASHIPFGPFMVLGFFLAVFFGDPLIQWYLHFTGLVK